MHRGRKAVWSWGALAGAGALLAASAAQAATFEVQFVENPPRAVIFGSGPIVKGDLTRFGRSLQEAKRRRLEATPLLVLQSNGGASDEGFAIGRSVRRNGIATAILPSTYCLSACSLIFFGGYDRKTKSPDRTVYGPGRLGVHHWGQSTIVGWDPKRPVPPSILAAIETRASQRFRSYFGEMRVSPEIWRRTYDTPFKGIYFVTAVEMAASAITVRPASDAPRGQFAAIQFGCGTTCPAPEQRQPIRVPPPPDAMRRHMSASRMTGAAYLKGWLKLIGQRVLISECTLWLPDATQAPCVVRENGERVGFILVKASAPERPGWALIRQRCSTPEPVDECRVELDGISGVTSQGAMLGGVSARFLSKQDRDRLPPPGEPAPAPPSSDAGGTAVPATGRVSIRAR